MTKGKAVELRSSERAS